MSLIRAAALRSAPSTLFTRSASQVVRRTASQPCLRVAQRSGRRGYASAHGAAKKTSDLPWAASAAVATAVGLYIALSPSEGDAHGHDDEHHHGNRIDEAEKAGEHKKKTGDEPAAKPVDEGSDDGGADIPSGEEEPKEAAEERKSSGKEQGGDSKDSSSSSSSAEDNDDSESSVPDQDETNAQEDSGTKDDSQKGMTKDKTDLKKRETDPNKGGTKVRMDSPAGKNIGEGASSGVEATDFQKGVSNTDTRHSEDPNADPGKSSKGEGTADTAKLKGTVKPDRPQK